MELLWISRIFALPKQSTNTSFWVYSDLSQCPLRTQDNTATLLEKVRVVVPDAALHYPHGRAICTRQLHVSNCLLPSLHYRNDVDYRAQLMAAKANIIQPIVQLESYRG